MPDFWLKITISLSAALLLIARFIWPDIRIDAVALGLLVVATLPWLSTLIQSAEFPGGWKVEFRDVESAGRKITGSEETSTTTPQDRTYLKIINEDANLALVGLRIELENRVRALAEKNNVDSNMPLAVLLQELRFKRIIDNDVFAGIQDLINSGNKAAHGANVDPSISNWAFAHGPQILAVLDRKLGN